MISVKTDVSWLEKKTGPNVTTRKLLEQEKAYIKNICDEIPTPKTLEQEKAHIKKI